jgi:hypothetical protein
MPKHGIIWRIDGSGGKKNKYGKKFTTYEDFEKEAKQWNKDNPGYKSKGGTTKVWVPGTAGKAGYYKTVKSTGSDISVNVNQEIRWSTIHNES